MEHVKLVFLGDGTVGKTCFLISYFENRFPDDYVPTVFDNRLTKQEIDGKFVEVGYWDYAGREDSDRLRPLMYPGTSCFLLFFSLVCPDSLENIKTKWVPEIQHHCPTTPFILVGSKLDLRENQEMVEKLNKKGLKPVTYETGLEFAKEIGAQYYVETSALNQIGLREAVTKAIHCTTSTLEKTQQKKRTMCLLQ